MIIMGMNNIGHHHKDREENDTVLELTFYPPHSQGVKVIISDFDMTKTSFVSLSLSDPNEDTRDSYDLRSLI